MDLSNAEVAWLVDRVLEAEVQFRSRGPAATYPKSTAAADLIAKWSPTDKIRALLEEGGKR